METLALRGGFLALMAVIDIVLAAIVLSAGAGGGFLLLLLLGWVTLAVYLGRRFFLQRRRWTRDRLQISEDLVEKMIGHRTRLAQQSPKRWHDGEDQALTSYLDGSKDVDRVTVKVVVLPRVWLAVALLGLAPTFLSGGGTIARVAISLGGILLAYRAMETLREGFSFFRRRGHRLGTSGGTLPSRGETRCTRRPSGTGIRPQQTIGGNRRAAARSHRPRLPARGARRVSDSRSVLAYPRWRAPGDEVALWWRQVDARLTPQRIAHAALRLAVAREPRPAKHRSCGLDAANRLGPAIQRKSRLQ